MRHSMLAILLILLGIAAQPLQARDGPKTAAIPASGVMGVVEAQLSPSYWIDLLPQADKELLSRAEINAQNARLFRSDPSMYDLRAMPATLAREKVAGWITTLSERPTRTMYDVDGAEISSATLDALMANLALDNVPAQQSTRYGLVVQRTAFRSFPTDLRVFSSKGDTDIDRFQETAEFPGTPVVIAHASADGQWLFVVSPRYAAWTAAANIAQGSAAEVFDYLAPGPQRIVTGAVVRTVFTREVPEVSELALDMSTRLPLQTGLPADQPVNGQTAYATHVVRQPIRHADGTLGFSPALVQKIADTSPDYLPLTQANILQQAFKFLGERYGWGHAYEGRDCSGFVSDVYRSMGVEMPRNTSRQAISPALTHRLFTDKDSHDARMQAVRELQVGDLVYIPGHVMMVIGWQGDEPYVIHDVGGMSYRTPDGKAAHVKLNSVAVTPLLPNQFNDQQTYIDRMTSIVRIRR